MLRGDAASQSDPLIRELGDRLPVVQTLTFAFPDSAYGFKLFLDETGKVIGFRPVELSPEGLFEPPEQGTAAALGDSLGLAAGALEPLGLRICRRCDPPRALGQNGCTHE